MARIIGIAVIVGAFVALLFPRALPRALRRLGRGVRTAGDMGREIATGQEAPESPLARYEVKAGELVRLRLAGALEPTGDAELQECVAAVGRRVAAEATRHAIPWRFQVVEDREANAFAIPGGQIFITRRLVELCAGDGDRLAGVLGHEIAHVDLRHAIHDLATRTAARTGARIVTLGRLGMLRTLARGMENLVLRGYGREREFEADRHGAGLAHRAGYAWSGLGDLLGALDSAGPQDGGPLEGVLRWLRTHPPAAERRARLASLDPGRLRD